MKTNEQYSDRLDFWDKKNHNIRSDFILNPQLLNLFSKVRNKKILDLGCGNGFLTRKIADFGNDVLGIDKSVSLIELAKQNKTKLRGQVNYLVGDISNLSLDYSSFDLAFAAMSFLYLDSEQFKNAFQEVSKVLSYSGKFIYADTHPANLLSSEKYSLMKYSLNDDFNYFKSSKISAEILSTDGSSFNTVYYHHSFEEIFSAAKEANLIIKEFYEPKPKSNSKNLSQLLAEQKLPSYVLMVFEKNKDYSNMLSIH